MTDDLLARTEDLLATLVGFPSISAESNLPLIHWVRAYLADHGVESTLLVSPDGTKANLLATVTPGDRPGVVLSGHTDVVPVAGQDWHSDPFTLVRHADRLTGRGTADMKGFLAVSLALVPLIQAAPEAPPVHLAFSYDEEVGCLGAPPLARAVAALPLRPWLVLVGEPTGMHVIHAHKGKFAQEVRIRGRAAHSSRTPDGVNAVEVAAALIGQLARMEATQRREGPFDPGCEPAWSTVHTGPIAGGTVLNIVPDHCTFSYEIRPLPGVDARAMADSLKTWAAETLLPAMHAVDPATGIDWIDLVDFPGLNIPAESEVVSTLLALTGDNAPGRVSFGTEAGVYAAHDLPTLVCGPGHIEQAHRPDEYVTPEQLQRCLTLLRRLLRA